MGLLGDLWHNSKAFIRMKGSSYWMSHTLSLFFCDIMLKNIKNNTRQGRRGSYTWRGIKMYNHFDDCVVSATVDWIFSATRCLLCFAPHFILSYLKNLIAFTLQVWKHYSPLAHKLPTVVVLCFSLCVRCSHSHTQLSSVGWLPALTRCSVCICQTVRCMEVSDIQ